MKCTYPSKTGLQFELEGADAKDIIKQLAGIQEIFDHEKCGACACTSLRYVTRVVDDNTYYELRCQNPQCRAKLGFGQAKKGGTLFPQRKNSKTGEYYENGGWRKYVPGEDNDDEPPKPASKTKTK